MRTVSLLLVVLSGGLPHVAAQPAVSAWVRAGVDQSAVGSLAEWQLSEQASLADLGIPAEETDAFPRSLSVQGGLGLRYEEQGTELGIEAGYGSTAGRLYYGDYSGTFVTDRTAGRAFVGAYVERTVVRVGGTSAGVVLTGRANVTAVRYRNRVEVEGRSVTAVDLDYSAVPLSFESSLVVRSAVSQRLSVRAQVGHEWSDDVGVGPGVEVGWRGFRAGLGAAVDLWTFPGPRRARPR